jgi:hypothetical protein
VTETNEGLFELFFFFFMLLIYIEQQHNEITSFFVFFICLKFKEKKKLDTNEFLQNQQETKILEEYNLINGAKLWYQMMRTSCSHGHTI